MFFNSKEELINKLSNLKEIGNGSQGTCYLDIKTNLVYKIFNQFVDNDEDKINYTELEFLKFNNIKNNTFIWPQDIITIESEIVGYITQYVNARPLSTINPLEIDLNDFCNHIKLAHKDIETLSLNGVLTFDLMYNLLYNNAFFITDCDEFNYSNKNELLLLEINKYNFNFELYYFLIAGYFDEFILDHQKLYRLYRSKEEDIFAFIKLLRNYLSEYVGHDVKKLSDAYECINKKEVKQYSYFRVLSK